MQQINWYPGHMAKAKRMLQENIKLVDAVAEIVDARAPAATRNPDFDGILKTRERIVFLNKADLADPALCKAWIRQYESQGIQAAAIVSTGAAMKKQAMALLQQATAEKVARMQAKGIRKTVRIMVVGIPNAGKSTFINRIAGENRAQTGDRPGVTRSKQWVKVGPYLELMDSPGLLWPKLEDQRLARHLAYIGSINDEIMDVESLSESLLSELYALCPEKLLERYPKLLLRQGEEDFTFLEGVARSRGFLLPGGLADTERAARVALDEYRGGKIARITWETPGAEEAPLPEEPAAEE